MFDPTEPTYIRFSGDVEENKIKALMNVIQSELTQGCRHFVILISSHGGSLEWGIAAYNFLKGIPAKVETHSFGVTDSMAVVLYCAGKKRYSVPLARFKLHGLVLTVSKPTSYDEKKLGEETESLKRGRENIARVIAENTGKTEEEIMKAMYEGKILNPQEAVEFGLVHEIKAELFESGAKVITIS